MGFTTITYLDKSGERSAFQINTPDLTIGNVENFTSEIPTNALGDLIAAVDALTLMTRQKASVAAKAADYSNPRPTDSNAQRERKLLLKFSDDVTGKKGSVTVPGIDMDLVAQDGTDAVSLTQTEVAALIAVIEGNYVSSIGNPITVYDARHVGRNN